MKNPNFTVVGVNPGNEPVTISQHRCPRPAERSLAATIRQHLAGGDAVKFDQLRIVGTAGAETTSYSLTDFRAAMKRGAFDGPEYR